MPSQKKEYSKFNNQSLQSGTYNRLNLIKN